MRRMLILILVPLGWALPASAQNSPPDQAAQQAPACQAPSGQSIGQNIRSDLARAGYRDIQMVPELVRGSRQGSDWSLCHDGALSQLDYRGDGGHTRGNKRFAG